MKIKKYDKICLKEKIKKKKKSYLTEKKTVDRGELIIKRIRKFSNQKKDQTAVHVTSSQEGLGEMSHN